MEYLSARQLVISWVIGCAVAGLALSVKQRRTADQSCWGSSPWQNEIAIWNLGFVTMMVGVLWSKKDVEPALLPGLFVLSLAFCINHVVALLRHRDQRYPTNIAAAVANGAGVVAILVHVALRA